MKRPLSYEMPDQTPTDFVERELDALVRLATGLCGTKTTAEDLVSAAITNMLQHWDSIHNPGAYARRSLVNLYLNECRRRKRHSPWPMFADDAGRTDPVSDAIVRMDVAMALAGPQPVQRAVVMLRFLDDLSVDDTARILRRPAGSVRRVSHEALKALRMSQLSSYNPNSSELEKP